MIRIGIISPSEIAFRRFLPALSKVGDFEYVGVACASETEWVGMTEEAKQSEKSKADNFQSTYGGIVFNSYQSIINSESVDAIYIPLPPALHYHWATKAIRAGKHVLVEKPATTSLAETNHLIELAEAANIALHENYMFVFHNQLQKIEEQFKKVAFGDVRLIRINFGFPQRPAGDFRYNKSLGGGALLDCGGYTLKYAGLLLGESAKIVYARLNYIKDFDVDMYGSAAMINDDGLTVQLAFGMDNSYKCDVEVWGSKSCLLSSRVLTAPDGFEPEMIVVNGGEKELIKLPADDAFMKSLIHFKECILNDNIKKVNCKTIQRQAGLVEEFKHKCSEL